MNAQNKILSALEAARYLGVAVGTLEVWRSTGRYGIPFLKVGRIVKYRLEDLDAFLEGRTYTNTAQHRYAA